MEFIMEGLLTCTDVKSIGHTVVATHARDRLEDATDASSRRHLEHSDQLQSVGQARWHAHGGDICHIRLGAQ